MESQTVVLLGYVLVLVLLAGSIGYMFGSSRTNARFRRRDVGKVVGSDLTFVLHDLDHSIKHDRNGREVVALQGSRYRTFAVVAPKGHFNFGEKGTSLLCFDTALRGLPGGRRSLHTSSIRTRTEQPTHLDDSVVAHRGLLRRLSVVRLGVSLAKDDHVVRFEGAPGLL